MWLKTYIVYKTSFDIKIENWKQEFILFINPLSFLLFIYGIGLFMKEKNRNRFVFITSIVLTGVLLANMVFYRFFNDFLTIPVLFQSSNMGDLGSSVSSLFQPVDVLLFVDLVILFWLLRKPAFRTDIRATRKERSAYYLLVAAVFFFNLGLAETERPQLLTRSFDREMLVKNISVYNFHVYDGVIQSKTSAQRAMADSTNLTEIENYVKANKKEPNQEMKGIAEGRNVIMVSLESTQNFVLNGAELNGQEISPYLNDLADKSYNFTNVYHQTGQGKTSDAEFLTDNSLYPLGRGAVFFTNPDNKFNATPEILKEKGYTSAVFHANNKSFWNRDLVYNAFGYDHFYDVDSYKVTPETSVGWGLKDKEFFEQTASLMKELPQPFYSKSITLTNHFPFELSEDDQTIDKFDSNSKTLNNYFTTVKYQDDAVKQFIESLKKEGLYENSIIVFYGDHYGISENHNEAMAKYLGKEVTPFESQQLQRVPFIVHIPGVTDKNPKEIDTVGGQIDIRPTVMNLLGVDSKDKVEFGNDLFSKDRLPFTVMRDGSFVTDKYVYTGNVCYDKSTGQPIEDKTACEPYIAKAKKELDYSDKIIYSDLLRFYNKEDQNEKQENK